MSVAVRAEDTQIQVACESCEMSDTLCIGLRGNGEGKKCRCSVCMNFLQCWRPGFLGGICITRTERCDLTHSISLHSYLLIRSIFTPLSVSRQREPSAVGSP